MVQTLNAAKIQYVNGRVFIYIADTKSSVFKNPLNLYLYGMIEN